MYVFLRSHVPCFLGPETHQLQDWLVGNLVFLPPQHQDYKCLSVSLAFYLLSHFLSTAFLFLFLFSFIFIILS